MGAIEDAIKAIESREPGEPFSYRKIAAIYGCSHAALSRRHRSVSTSCSTKAQNQQALHPQQELELLRYTELLTRQGLPPTRPMIRCFASDIAKKESHKTSVTSFVFSAAGDRLASASRHGTVRVWDVKQGQLVQILKDFSRGAREDFETKIIPSVAFSAVGDRLASTSGAGTVRAWDAKTGQLLHTLESTGYVSSVAFSNDGPCLETDRGLIPLPPIALPAPRLPRRSPAQRIFFLETWVMADSEDTLWIPANHNLTALMFTAVMLRSATSLAECCP
jgi:hypothetical protein